MLSSLVACRRDVASLEGMHGCNSTLTWSAGGRVLFAGTETGCIRAYKYPLNGEFQEFRCCGAAIAQLMLTHDDAVLFAAGVDGSLFVFDVKDRDPARLVGKRWVLCSTSVCIDGAVLCCGHGWLPVCDGLQGLRPSQACRQEVIPWQ